MLNYVCLLALISAVCGASVGNVDRTTEKREIIPLLRYERENNPDGSFKFSFEGGDQSFREETAHLVDVGTDDEALEVSGSYRYIDADGNTVEVHYTAGKNGFVPTGTNILSEITAAAKAAADLPQSSELELKRKGRSNVEGDLQAEESVVVEQKAEESKVVEQKAEESKVVEPKAEESKDVEQKAEESKVVEQKAEESKVVESKAEESKEQKIEVVVGEPEQESKVEKVADQKEEQTKTD